MTYKFKAGDIVIDKTDKGVGIYLITGTLINEPNYYTAIPLTQYHRLFMSTSENNKIFANTSSIATNLVIL